MRVLGIDPGTVQMGIGVVDSHSGQLSVAHVSVISVKRALSLPVRLLQIHRRLNEIAEELQPTVVAVEEPFVAKNAKAAIAVGQAQGIAMIVAAEHGLEVSGYSPREVKQSVTDHGGSSKEQVKEMVELILGLNTQPYATDATDALAVAICHVNASREQELIFRN